MPTLPLEITEKIISTLTDDDPSLSSTKACALVCHEFHHLCRKHIFASISLNSKYTMPPRWIHDAITPMLQKLLATTPEIADYIRNLTYTIHPDDINDISLLHAFKKITGLKFLCISLSPRFHLSWNDNPLRPALLHLLHLPTLVDFRLFLVKDFLVTDLAPCINLEHFKFSQIEVFEANDTSVSNSPDSSIRLRQISAGAKGPVALLKMRSVQRADGTPFIDFSSLTSLSVNVFTSPDIEASHSLFSQCKKLIDAFICADKYINWTQMGLLNMLHPSMLTLKHLHVELDYHMGADDPLDGLPFELEAMQNHNIIETITIIVCIEIDLGMDFGIGDEWSRLDQALAQSGWPKLRRVSLEITTWSFFTLDGGLRHDLNELPETDFPQLSSNKYLSFEFVVNFEGEGA